MNAAITCSVVCCWVLLVGIQDQKTGIDQSASSDTKTIEDSQRDLIATAKALSASTLRDGLGWKEYGKYLHENFTRWAEGQPVWDRTQSVDAIKQWWDAGYRVAESDEEIISMQIVGHTAIVRKKMSEQYVNENGDSAGDFNGFVTQVWMYDSGRWKLVAATIQRITDAQ